jgi:hypothetical protein
MAAAGRNEMHQEGHRPDSRPLPVYGLLSEDIHPDRSLKFPAGWSAKCFRWMILLDINQGMSCQVFSVLYSL